MTGKRLRLCAVLLLAGGCVRSVSPIVGRAQRALGETANWQQRASASEGPPARNLTGMAYDSLRQRTVLFGGCDLGNQIFGDTWEWDGHDWAKVATTGPSPRCRQTMAYDSLRHRSILFGGFWVPLDGGAGITYADTWAWDGVSWTELAASGPPAYLDPGMAYDSARDRMVLFDAGQTWEWDGTTWTEVSTGGPSARSFVSMDYDSARQRTVLFGGTSNSPRYFGDTWEWDGTTWTEVSTSGPAPRYSAALAYDSARGRSILFGGQTASGDIGDTWQWDGTSWVELASTGPQARESFSMVFDSARGRAVMQGGYNLAAVTLPNDTWELHTWGSSCTAPAECDTAYCLSGTCCNTGCASSADCCAPQACVVGACASGAAPAITTSAPPAGYVFEPYRYRVAATGDAPLSYSVSAPSGAAIDPLSGEIYFTPTTAGSLGFTVGVSNPWGADSASFDISVNGPRPPTLLHDASATALVGTPYALDASGTLDVTGATPMSFAKLAGPAELHLDAATGRIDWTPTAAGTVSVTVSATNAYGADTYTFEVAVAAAASQAAPRAVATASPASGPAPLLVRFDSSGSTAGAGGTLVGRSWVFGDGSPPSSEVAPVHVYAHGAYTARLTLADNLGQSAGASVSVQASTAAGTPPLPHLVAAPVSGPAPLTVSFSCDCAQAAGASLHWSFGDGQQSTAAAPTHVYATAGGYQATLEALDPNTGEVGTDSAYVTVGDGEKQPPMVRAFAMPPSGDAPLTVRFSAELGDPSGRVITLAWSLGEGDTSNDPTPQKTFDKPGLYHIDLRALDDNGLQSSASTDVAVTVGGVLPPLILTKAGGSAEVGVAYQYAPQARGGRPLTWTLGKMVNGVLAQVPDGCSVDPASGVVSWTPNAGQAGAQPITLVARNSAGVAFQDFVVTVDSLGSSRGCGCAVGGAGAPLGPLALLLCAGLTLALGRRRLL